MNSAPSFERIVSDRLRAEAPLHAPDYLLVRTLQRVTQTRQATRRVIGTPERIAVRMTLFAAAAVTAVVVLAFVGLRFLPGLNGPDGGPGGLPTWTGATPSPSPTVQPLPVDSELEPGRYYVDVALHNYWNDVENVPDDAVQIGDGTANAGDTARITFEVPSGWSAVDGRTIVKDGAGANLTVSPWAVDRVFTEPCAWLSGGNADPPMMQSLDGLAGALVAWWDGAADRPNATQPTQTSLAGLDARFVEVTAPQDLDLATCSQGRFVLFADPLDNQRWVQEPGQTDRLWVVDVDGYVANTIYWQIPEAVGVDGAMSELLGGLLVIDAGSSPSATDADLAEMQAIVDSIQLELMPREP